MVQTTLRLPKNLYSKLKKEAKQRGMSLNGFLISILWGIEDERTKTKQDPT